jgi:hypothetical protein
MMRRMRLRQGRMRISRMMMMMMRRRRTSMSTRMKMKMKMRMRMMRVSNDGDDCCDGGDGGDGTRTFTPHVLANSLTEDDLTMVQLSAEVGKPHFFWKKCGKP